jgi:uncharacterized membrane protein
MRSRYKQLALLAFLLLASFGVRLAASVYWQSRLDDRFGMGDSETYWALGQAIAQDQPYEYGPEHARIFRSPGYPLALVPLFWLSSGEPSVMWARVENALFGTLVVGVVWCLAQQLFDPRAGLIAGAVTAFYPGAVAVSAMVLSETPFCLLMVVQFVLWTAAWRAKCWRRAGLLGFVVGVVAGAATLVRPSWLLFTPFAALLAVLVGRTTRRQQPAEATVDGADNRCRDPLVCRADSGGRQLWIGTAIMVGLLVTMAPWWIRNARVTGHFVPTTLQVGASLYDGLNPEASGGSNMDLVPPSVAQLRQQAVEASGSRQVALELEIDRQYRTEALAFVGNNPGRAIELAGVKLVRMWNIWPNEPRFSSWALRLIVAVAYGPILVLGIFGAVRTIRCGWPYTLCWLPAVYFTLLHLAFVSSIRYRQPAMLGLIVLAAGVVATWTRSDGGKPIAGSTMTGKQGLA